MKFHQPLKAALYGTLLSHAAPGRAAPASTVRAVVPAANQDRTTSRLAEAFQAMLVTQNMCVSYAYDQNGNRTVQTTSTPGTQPVWGSNTYPCFVWGAQ